MSKKALRNGHAEHIHAHCDCEYAVRFDGKSTVAGYDPDKYLEEYYDANGDINEMRRKRYAQNKDVINARKRELYASKKADIDHVKAHELASEKYNYPKEALEYYGNLKKHKKSQ